MVFHEAGSLGNGDFFQRGLWKVQVQVWVLPGPLLPPSLPSHLESLSGMKEVTSYRRDKNEIENALYTGSGSGRPQ